MSALGQERPFEQFDRTAGLSALLPFVTGVANNWIEPLRDIGAQRTLPANGRKRTFTAVARNGLLPVLWTAIKASMASSSNAIGLRYPMVEWCGLGL